MTYVTELLMNWSQGDATALDRLIPLLYEELHLLADNLLRRESGPATLQPTALVNELYLRLVDQRKVDFRGRNHFMGVAAKIMRRMLVDRARRHKAAKRGGGAPEIGLDENILAISTNDQVLEIDRALNRLEGLDSRKAKVVELKFFGGMSNQEAADVLEISPTTVERDWAMAKAWLYREMQLPGATPPTA